MNKQNLTQKFISQLEAIIDEFNGFKVKAKYDDLSDVVDPVTTQTFLARARASIARLSGTESAYSKQLETVLKRTDTYDSQKVAMAIGIVTALLVDLKSGYLTSLQELIHGEVFADFLEIADYLCHEGYKDASAVIAGGTLESHIRQLCIKNNIEVQTSTSKGIESKRADQMNADLARDSIYSKLDQKNVTAWLDLRNKAAHAKYTEYSQEQVELLIAGIRDFITRNPA